MKMIACKLLLFTLAVSLPVAAAAQICPGSAGCLDAAFGTGGIAAVSYQGSPYGGAMQSDGKVLVLSGGPSEGTRLVRFNADGTLDDGSANDSTPGDSFGTGGIVTLYWPSPTSGQNGWAYDLAIQTVGGSERIVVEGAGAVLSKNKLIWGTRVDRLLLNGTIDTSFGNQGSVTIVPANSTEQTAESVAIQPDQKIVLSSWNTIYRLNANGSTDTSFGSGGKASILISSRAMQIQSDGKIVVAGYTTVKNKTLAAVSRHNANGSVDTSFGSSGKATVDLAGGSVWDVVIGSNGDIYAGGTSGTTTLATNAVAARFTPFGQLDAGFGNGGVATFDSGIGDQCRRIGLQPDGKVLLAGNTISGLSSTSDLLAVRFDTAGNLDYSFGTYGGVILDLFGGGETSRGVFVQNIGTQALPDYRIVVTGGGAANGGPSYTFAVRLTM